MLLLVPILIIAIAAVGCGKAAVQPSDEGNSSNSDQGAVTTNQDTTEGSQSQSAVEPQSPVAPEDNPPGDIPDNQVFVNYQPAGESFAFKVPEGWAQTTSGTSAEFTDKLNTVSAKWFPAASQPTLEQANSAEVQELTNTELAFQLVGIKQVTLPAGPAILIEYQKNSAPNPVTGKQYRMDVQRYEFFRNGQQVNLTLESPVGADNVDPWTLISKSFKWL